VERFSHCAWSARFAFRLCCLPTLGRLCRRGVRRIDPHAHVNGKTLRLWHNSVPSPVPPASEASRQGAPCENPQSAPALSQRHSAFASHSPARRARSCHAVSLALERAPFPSRFPPLQAAVPRRDHSRPPAALGRSALVAAACRLSPGPSSAGLHRQRGWLPSPSVCCEPRPRWLSLGDVTYSRCHPLHDMAGCRECGGMLVVLAIPAPTTPCHVRRHVCSVQTGL